MEVPVAIGRRRRMAAFGGLALAVTLAVTACAKDQSTTETPDGASVALVEAGALTVCTSLPYPPFQEDVNGKVQGFDVDIVDLAAAKLGVTQKIVDMQFDQIKSGAALEAGTCDLAAAGMTITDERKQHLTFSDPYFDEAIAFMTPTGEKVMTIDEVKSKNLTLGVQTATTSLTYAQDNGLDPKQFNDAGKQLEALKAGTVDVILQDLPVISDWLKKPEIGSAFELGGSITTGAQYGFGLKKAADPVLLKAINDALAEAKASGKYAEIYEKWMGSAPVPAPSGS